MYGFKKLPVLSAGGRYATKNLCIMELVSLVGSDGEYVNDHPRFVDHRVSSLFRVVNDSVGDKHRVNLLGFFDRMFHCPEFDDPSDPAWIQFESLVMDIAKDVLGRSRLLPIGVVRQDNCWWILSDICEWYDGEDLKFEILDRVLGAAETARGLDPAEFKPIKRRKVAKLIKKKGYNLV